MWTKLCGTQAIVVFLFSCKGAKDFKAGWDFLKNDFLFSIVREFYLLEWPKNIKLPKSNNKIQKISLSQLYHLIQLKSMCFADKWHVYITSRNSTYIRNLNSYRQTCPKYIYVDTWFIAAEPKALCLKTKFWFLPNLKQANPWTFLSAINAQKLLTNDLIIWSERSDPNCVTMTACAMSKFWRDFQ